MELDDATGEPINICAECGAEVVGYVDDPEISFYCDECENKMKEDEE